ncbi:MAG: MoaD/ThiS family protein [Verrucomicrobiales bacterium]|jgi:molybdopterin synthase sulfur carrier subunit|nr:MoaD/ThiS family protein [Verrucomicrobiales bacterium]
MAIEVSIPTPLRGLTNNLDTVSAEGATVAALIDDLEKKYPGIKTRLVDDAGQLRRFVNIYVNGEDVRFLQAQATPLAADAEVSIVPAIAGG